MEESEILKVKAKGKSPLKVVYQKEEGGHCWAIVLLEWCGNYRLGMRWFYSKVGLPQSSGRPVWLIIPDELCITILNGLPLKPEDRKEIESYLSKR